MLTSRAGTTPVPVARYAGSTIAENHSTGAEAERLLGSGE